MSSTAELILAGVAARATYLVPILAAAFLLGEPLAKFLRFPALRTQIGGLVRHLNIKLNRSSRSTATRLYRGIVALLMLLVPSLAIGILLLRPAEWVQLLAAILFTALFGELVKPYQLLRIRRAAKSGTLTLQSNEPPFLFPDTHAQLRYTILVAADRVALLIGASLFYLAASLPGALLYLMLAASARYYAPAHTGNLAFGWAAHALFRLLDAVPRFITSLLLWIAALFTPRTAPFSTLRHVASAAKQFHGWLAYLLQLSLGGPVPTAAGDTTLPWLGIGTPKPDAIHLSRAIQLAAIATLLWILLLASTIYVFPDDLYQ